MLLLLPTAHAEDLRLPQLPEARITVDAHDDEEAWAQAVELPNPTPFEPTADVEPVGSVRSRLLSDDQGIYVFFEVTDPNPELVRVGLGRRDTRDDDKIGRAHV